MFRPIHGGAAGRFPASISSGPTTRQAASHKVASRKAAGRRQTLRARGWGETNSQQPFMPPEIWHEPADDAGRNGYRVITQAAGAGFRHVVTEAEVRERLARLPEHLVRPLEVVQLSSMTRKKRGLPLYGMQWGTAIYLYPIEESLVERYHEPPKPAQRTEARMYGGRWIQESTKAWLLVWTEAAVKDFYLNNILIHELAHVLDLRNTRTIDRERFAEAFAVEHGYLPTQSERRTGRGRHTLRHG